MAPPPPTTPLLTLPSLGDCYLSPFPPEKSSFTIHGSNSRNTRTASPDRTAAPRSRRCGLPSSDCASDSRPLPRQPMAAPMHSDMVLLSAPGTTTLQPYALFPPLLWVVKPLCSRAPAGLASLDTERVPDKTSVHTGTPLLLPPSSHLASRHHPPLLRHLLDTSVPFPCFTDLPSFLSSAAFAAEGSVVPLTERRRLSAPPTARYPRMSVSKEKDLSATLPMGAKTAPQEGPWRGLVDTAAGGLCVTPKASSGVSTADSASAYLPRRTDAHRGSIIKQTEPSLNVAAETPTAGGLHFRSEVKTPSWRQGTSVGPLLRQLLTHQGTLQFSRPAEADSSQLWQQPAILIPPFFSSPAALQRSENTLQSELASSALRCQTAKLKQQRLLKIAAAVVHRAVCMHANQIADVIEQYAVAAAAARAVLPVASTGKTFKPGRSPGTGKAYCHGLHTGSNSETDGGETVRNGYYNWICGPQELSRSRSSLGGGGALQSLPVIVATAGADVADHRLAVHGLLRECLRRSQIISNGVNPEVATMCPSQEKNFFLRIAVLRPSHCSSIGAAMHVIHEQITKPTYLFSSAPLFEEKRHSAFNEKKSLLRRDPQRRAYARNSACRFSRRNVHANPGQRDALHCGVNAFLADTCLVRDDPEVTFSYDGAAAAAWGDSTWSPKCGAFFSFASYAAAPAVSGGSDTLRSSFLLAARHRDEAAVAAELQQLTQGDIWGPTAAAAAGASSARLQSVQNETAATQDGGATAATLAARKSTERISSCDTTLPSSREGLQREPQEVNEFVQEQYERHLHAQQKEQLQCYLQQLQQLQRLRTDSHSSYFTRMHFSKARSAPPRSAVRRTHGGPEHVCGKLARWWAAQLQQLQISSRQDDRCGRCDGGNGGAAAAADAANAAVARARTATRRIKGMQPHNQQGSVSCHLRGIIAARGRYSSAATTQGRFRADKYDSMDDEDDDGDGEEEPEQQQQRRGGLQFAEKQKMKRMNGVEEVVLETSTSDGEGDSKDEEGPRLSGCGKRRAAAAAEVPAEAEAAATSRALHRGRNHNMRHAALVIVLEEAEAFPIGVLGKLLHLLALLRKQLSLPFTVVATASTSATMLQHLCDAPLSSSCSLTVEPAMLLQPARVQQQLLQMLLCCPAALPFALPIAAAERLLHSVEETSPSVLQLLRHVQLLLRVFYQHHPLAFLSRGLDGVAALLLPESHRFSADVATNIQQRSAHSCGPPHPAATATVAAAPSIEPAIPATKKSIHDARGLHALHVVKQLRRRVELLSLASLTEDHVGLLRQLLRHSNEVYIHLTAALQEGLFFFDRCCWQQAQLYRQNQRRALLTAMAATSNGASALACSSSSLLPPLKRDAAASTLALRSRPEEDGEQRPQQSSSSTEAATLAAATAVEAGVPPLQGAGGVHAASSTADSSSQRRGHAGCRRSAGCVARRSALTLLQRWWGGRGLLLLQKVEEEEKERQALLQQQHQQVEEQKRPSFSVSSSTTTTTTAECSRHNPGRSDNQEVPQEKEQYSQGHMMSLKLKLLCKEVLPAVSVELLQRRVECCMAYRLLFVLQQQLQRCRRLASDAAADVGTTAAGGGRGVREAPHKGGKEGGGGGASAQQGAGNKEVSTILSQQQQDENAAAQEESLLLRIAAEEEAHSNCHQTVETLALIIGTHEESSCLLRKYKSHTRVQEMAKACFAVEQDVRGVVHSLFAQFAVAAPARLAAGAAVAHCHEVLVDPAALVLPLKLFRVHVKREARLLRVLAAAEEAQQQQEEQIMSDMHSCASGVASAASPFTSPPLAQAWEPPLLQQQKQLPFGIEATTHTSEIVRLLDTLDILIRDLAKAAQPSGVSYSVITATSGAASSCGSVKKRKSSTAHAEKAASSQMAGVDAQGMERRIAAQNASSTTNKREELDTGLTAERTFVKRGSQGAGATAINAAAQQERLQVHPAVGALRMLVSLKRRFLRWVEEALLLLLLPLPGWHPLGGELAVWGGALAFEVVTAAAQLSAAEAKFCPAAAKVLGSQLLSNCCAQRRSTAAHAPSGRLAAAADFVCSSLEAAPQAEILHHAVMSSTSFLERFSALPLEKGGIEEEAKSQVLQVQPRQQDQRQQLQGKQESFWSRRVAEGRVPEGQGRRICVRTVEPDAAAEAVKLEDVAIVLRLVSNAGRRINMWDLFCAFCRDLLRDRIQKKKQEMKKSRQAKEREGGGVEEEVWQSRLENVGSNVFSSSRAGSTGCSPRVGGTCSISHKREECQRRRRRYTRMSESDIEDEVLRRMETESCSVGFDAAVAHKIGSDSLWSSSNTSAPTTDSKGSLYRTRKITAEKCRRNMEVFSFVRQGDLRHANLDSDDLKCAVDSAPGGRMSRTGGAAGSAAADSSSPAEVPLAVNVLLAPGGTLAVEKPYTRLPCTLLQQLQLRFAIAVETLDNQLGVIRLPSTASAAAAAERLMFAGMDEDNAAAVLNFSGMPRGAEQVDGADKVSPQRLDEEEESNAEGSDVQEEKEEERTPATRNFGDTTGTQRFRMREAGGRQLQRVNANEPEGRSCRALPSTRSSQRRLAAGALEKNPHPVSNGMLEGEAKEKNLLNLTGDEMVLTQKLKSMRDLLRNVYVRRTHFGVVYVQPAAECVHSAEEVEENDFAGYSDEGSKKVSSRKGDRSGRKKSHRRCRKRNAF